MFRVLFGVKNFKVSKKPASILAVVILITVVAVSGQYLSSSLDEGGKVNPATNNTPNNTTNSNQDQDLSTSSVQSPSTSDDQTYDTSGDLEETTTTTKSGGGKGKNRS